jgi:hypothetical protein
VSDDAVRVASATPQHHRFAAVTPVSSRWDWHCPLGSLGLEFAVTLDVGDPARGARGVVGPRPDVPAKGVVRIEGSFAGGLLVGALLPCRGSGISPRNLRRIPQAVPLARAGAIGEAPAADLLKRDHGGSGR